MSAFVVATLLGFLQGYQRAAQRDVDRMGFDLLITAKGCPYEAATLMLRGGVGLRYMPDGVVGRLEADPGVVGTFPTLIHPVRDPANPEGMAIFKGVSPGWFQAMGMELEEGAWFTDDGRGSALEGVVIGYEAAEYEQRHAGDAYLIGDRQTRVLGVLARTGTQVDGSVLLPLQVAQATFDLPDKLTGVGVRVDRSEPEQLEVITDRYHAEAELQVVSLSQVEKALRKATRALRDVVVVLAWILAIMAAAVLLNTTLLRTLGEYKRFFVLHAIGFRRRFIFGAALVENMIIVVAGSAAGLVLSVALGGLSSRVLTGYLPYAPDGNLVDVPVPVAVAIVGGAILIGVLATVLPLLRLRRFGDLSVLREG